MQDLEKKTLPVSLVIPCYERHDQTRDLLGSLATASTACEVLLIDDASPNSLENIAADFPELQVRYIRNSQNKGPAYSRNLGVSEATYDFIAFTDNDCIVDRDWLLHLYGSIAKSPPRVAGVGGRVIAAGSDIFSRYYDYHKILDPWYFRGKHYYVTTANAIFKRHPFGLAGGFDITVLGAGGEDPGLCFKLQNAGYSIGYNPDALIRHQYAATLSSFARTFLRYGYGCAGQSMKYFKPQQFVQGEAFGALEIEE